MARLLVFISLVLVFPLVAQEKKTEQRTLISSTFQSLASIHVMLPKDSSRAQVYASKFYIGWKAKGSYGPYVVSFKDRNNRLVWSTETNSDRIEFNFDNDQVFKYDMLYVTVFAKTNREFISGKHVIRRFGKTQREFIERSVISRKLDKTTAAGQLAYANLFEDAELYIDAVDAHLRAIDLEVKVPDYRWAFDEFLARHGFAL